MQVYLYSNEKCLAHHGYTLLSERPDRLRTLKGLFDGMAHPQIESAPATHDVITLAHEAAYVNYVRAASRPRRFGQAADLISSRVWGRSYLQYYLRPMAGTYEAASYAAGGVYQAVDAVLKGDVVRAFCAGRPPGHHAEPAFGAGFCFFNNVAIGALHAARQGQRVVIVDFDHHHGNGTQAIVEARGNGEVLLVSSHYEHCKYAGSTRDHALPDTIVPIPLKTGSDASAILAAYQEKAVPAIKAFKPDLMMLSAGFDMHQDDPLSSVKMKSPDFATLTAMLRDTANESCNGKIVSALEGGYDCARLKECVKYHIDALAL